jgi:D-alanine-D-alanine ligase
MNVLILHNSPADDALADEQDVLDQVAAVRAALEGLGHRAAALPCTLDLGAATDAIRAARSDVVFNLVESLGRTDRLAPLATLLLDAMGVPYTGSRTQALLTANSKLATKQRLAQRGLPSAEWTVTSASGETRWLKIGNMPVILKPVWEHASFGMDDRSVLVPDSPEELREALRRREQHTQRPWFAERFIDGREFNLSLVAGGGGEVAVLPPAEIEFVDFPDERPRIVGSAAKWDPQASEYHTTPRRFVFPPSDRSLLDELKRLARECWTWFDLRGYARVDFRVDSTGRPWILEVNANPCLTPDAGLAAAAAEGGMDYWTLIGRILESAVDGSRS